MRDNVTRPQRIQLIVLLIAIMVLAPLALFYWTHNLKELRVTAVGSRPDIGNNNVPKTNLSNQRGKNHQAIQIRPTAGIDLSRQIREGDAALAVEVFQFTTACHRASQVLNAARLKESWCHEQTDPAAVNSCRQEIRSQQSLVDVARDQAQTCDGISAIELNKARFESTVVAAKNGNQDAQVCFVQSDFDLRNTPMSDAQIEQHQDEAIAYAKAALARGDWRMVALLSTGSQAVSHNKGLLSLVTSGDDLSAYSMMRLLRLGATGEYAAQLDDRLAEYTTARARGLRGYDPNDLQKADQWAQQEYDQYFANSPQLNERPEICPLK